MKIAHYIPSDRFPPKGYGGTERVAYWLGQAQAELGHEVVYLCHQSAQIPFASVVEVPKQFHDLTPFVPNGTDIVQLYETPSFKLDYPVLVNIGGNGAPAEKYHRNSVFVSAKHAENHHWTEYVYNGINPSEYPLETSKDNYLLFLAKAAWIVKNLPGSIHIANRAGLTLQVAGGKAPFWCKNTISHGTVDGEKKMDLLKHAQALLFPIIWDEPFGIATIEALACGTPVIATPRGAMPEIIDESCGILADSLDELVDAVFKVSRLDPWACRERVLQNFTHMHMAEKYLTYYSKVIRDNYLRDGEPTPKGNPRQIIGYKKPAYQHGQDLMSALYIKEYWKR
jgi:glycosyltransferase involved in cell wall biosynthesis